MCTAITEGNLFGRTLDLECSYGESIVITPRKFKLDFLYEEKQINHAAIIGVAHIHNGIPLYYDAINEHGLAVAALNFPSSAVYLPLQKGKHNIASFELIPWILGCCKSVAEAKALLSNTNLTPDSISDEIPTTPLHWMISDATESITAEPVREGLKIYENAVGTLTNEPTFDFHMTNLTNYMSLSSLPPKNSLCSSIELKHYSRGMGAIGLPGDYSSASRFVRAVFAKSHTLKPNTKNSEISRFFHIMDSVTQPLGCVITDEGRPVSTVYTSCADLSKGIYYYTTYNCRRIHGVKMSSVDLNGKTVIEIPMKNEEDIDK